MITSPHIVKCLYCGKSFDRDKVPFEQVSARRYAHLECAAAAKESISKEEKDKKELEEYIMFLLKEDYISPRVRKQMKDFVENYHYTYSGMKKALVYFYEIKKNDISKANGGIGIIPYCYENAKNYYYAIWLAQQKNENKIILDYTPKVIEVRLPPPEIKKRKRNIFSFLEEDI